ncbi:hypothetical protein ORG37_19010 [Rahnella perminowiae]|uniref:hypothetical protein n=1 Tax=Rahnella perminowiae TaxID=2816244 RepID=UPI00224A894E|nr:hypothetical protein [Rahnella perminowiae]MCX2945175.1 hypothetical protein [Rahnella perminowiae]
MFDCAWFSFQMGSGGFTSFSSGGFYLILQQDVTPSRHSENIKNPVLFALKMLPFVVKYRYISKYITKNHLGERDFAALEYAPLPRIHYRSATDRMNQLLALVPKLFF